MPWLMGFFNHKSHKRKKKRKWMELGGGTTKGTKKNKRHKKKWMGVGGGKPKDIKEKRRHKKSGGCLENGIH